jgi:hypothetical protein
MRIEYEGLALAVAPVATDAITISKIHGFKVAANDRFLQLHNTKGTPTTATILRVWPIYGSAPFGEGFIEDDITCSEGATFAVSSTANTYTASAETVDIFVSGDAAFDDTGTTVVGDYTTTAETLPVWAAGSPKKLVRLEVSDVIGSGPCFVQIHADATPATDKIVASFPLALGGTMDKFFGAGISPSRMVSQAVFDGCTIALSATQSTYTALGSDVDYIRATYRS